LAGVEGQVADEVDRRRFVVEVHPKTGEMTVRDNLTGALLDVVDCARLLNEAHPNG
jgi:hypothetical protein